MIMVLLKLDTHMTIKIEVFTAPGCAKCGRAKDVLRDMVSERQDVEWREVDILQDMDYAVDLGVLSTPAIAINGVLVFTGLPSQKKLLHALESSC